MPTPLAIDANLLAARLRGGCGLNVESDSLFRTFSSGRMIYGLLRRIPVPMNGVYIIAETGTGGTHNGLFGNAPAITNLVKTTREPPDAEVSPFDVGITEGTVLHKVSEFDWIGDTVNNSTLLAHYFVPQFTPHFYDGSEEWADWSWVGAPGMQFRNIYYQHSTSHPSMRVLSLAGDASVSIDLDTSGSEGIAWQDILVERADPTTGGSWGAGWRTSNTATEDGSETFVPIGARVFVPGRKGVQLSVTTYGGSLASDHSLTAHVSNANLAKWVEAMQIDTVILWFHDSIASSTFATDLETLGNRWITAINTARGIDPTIQSPLIVCVATWDDETSTAVLATHPAAIASMVSGKSNFVFVNMYDMVNRKHGPVINWDKNSSKEYLDDAVHTTIAGSNEFSTMFFNAILSGGNNRRLLQYYGG